MKSLRAWVKKNRVDIDSVIRFNCSNCRLNDEERELWVMNDEGLYNWAKSEGVNV